MTEQPDPRLNSDGEIDPEPQQTENGTRPGDADVEPAEIVIPEAAQ